MRGSEESFAVRAQDELVEPPLRLQVDAGEAGNHPVGGLEVLAAGERVHSLLEVRAKQVDLAAGGIEGRAQSFGHVFQDAEQADHGRRINRTALGFVVERDVAANHRRPEHETCLGDAADGVLERVIDLEFLRVPEVQAVGYGDWCGAGADHVARRFGDSNRAAGIWVEVAEAAVAIGRDRDPLRRPGHANYSSVSAWRDHGVVQHLVVVLAEHAALGSDVRAGEEPQEDIVRFNRPDISERAKVERVQGREFLWTDAVATVLRGLGRDIERHMRYFDAVLANDNFTGVGDDADGLTVQLPVVEECLYILDVFFLCDDEHALLAFGEHDLVGTHALFAAWHALKVQNGAGAALGAAFDDGRGKPGGAEVLQADDPVAVFGGEFVAGLHQELFHERVADLDCRAHLFEAGLRVRAAGEAARAVDAVPAGIGADEEENVPDSGRAGALQAVGSRDANAHRVDQRVSVVGAGEEHFAADSWDAEAVPVPADAANDAIEEEPVLGVFRRAESERIKDSDGVGAHCEDIAHDSADAGGGALVGLDGRRVVVGFDLLYNAEAAADVDGSRVFGAHLGQDVVAAGREEFEQRFAVLVTAVLAPEGAEHPEFDFVRLAAELLDEHVVFGA